MQFTWHFWPNQRIVQLLPHSGEFDTRHYICFSEITPEKNSGHEMANEAQKELANKLICLKINSFKIIQKVSFNERGINIELTGTISRSTSCPKIENAICELYEEVMFNGSIR